VYIDSHFESIVWDPQSHMCTSRMASKLVVLIAPAAFTWGNVVPSWDLIAAVVTVVVVGIPAEAQMAPASGVPTVWASCHHTLCAEDEICIIGASSNELPCQRCLPGEW